MEITDNKFIDKGVDTGINNKSNQTLDYILN